MGIEPFLTASAVDCIAAQRLARKLCAYCKRPQLITVEALRTAGFHADDDIDGYEPVGCARCNYTGFRGRLGLFEVLLNSDELRDLTIERASSDAMRAVAIQQGMRPLRDDGLEKVRMGITSIDEVTRVT
jgi:type IV pilus assembly protein PilB